MVQKGGACRTRETYANLCVTFFTTKPGGSSIGLVLSRQIAEGHSGTLTLANREGARGTRAVPGFPSERQPAGRYSRRRQNATMDG